MNKISAQIWCIFLDKHSCIYQIVFIYTPRLCQVKRSVYHKHPVCTPLKPFMVKFYFLDFLYNRCITYSCVLTPEELTEVVFEDILPIICTQPQGVPVNFICRRLGHLIYNRFAAKFKGEKGVSEKVSVFFFLFSEHCFFVS